MIIHGEKVEEWAAMILIKSAPIFHMWKHLPCLGEIKCSYEGEEFRHQLRHKMDISTYIYVKSVTLT